MPPKKICVKCVDHVDTLFLLASVFLVGGLMLVVKWLVCFVGAWHCVVMCEVVLHWLLLLSLLLLLLLLLMLLLFLLLFLLFLLFLMFLLFLLFLLFLMLLW